VAKEKPSCPSLLNYYFSTLFRSFRHISPLQCPMKKAFAPGGIKGFRKKLDPSQSPVRVIPFFLKLIRENAD